MIYVISPNSASMSRESARRAGMRRMGVSCICGAIAKVGSPKYTAEVPGREQQNNNETTREPKREPKRDQNETRGHLLCNQLQHATLIHFVQAAQPGDCPGSPASHAVHANSPGKSGLPVVTRGNCTQIIVMGRILVDCPGVRFLCQFGKCPDVLCTCQLYDTTFLGGWLQLFLTNKVGQEFLEFFTQNMFGLNFHIADWKESALHSAAAFEASFSVISMSFFKELLKCAVLKPKKRSTKHIKALSSTGWHNNRSRMIKA